MAEREAEVVGCSDGRLSLRLLGSAASLREGLALDEAMRARLNGAIRSALGPRYLPSEILQVQAVPRTLSGKKMELPVRKLLLGADPARVMNRDAMANADCVAWYVEFARARGAGVAPAVGQR